jgi:E3 SUMO-protein ligase PIAS1
MALMISVKSACQLGWFPERETQELLAIIDLMWNGFSCPENVTSCVNSPVTLISQVIERFYPCVKLGHILVSFEAKVTLYIIQFLAPFFLMCVLVSFVSFSQPESKMMMKDFHISKKMPHSPKQKVGLFVVRTEDISRSNCIVHPQGVSFLLNGKGIDKRVNISMVCGFHCFLDMFWKYLLRTLMQVIVYCNFFSGVWAAASN